MRCPERSARSSKVADPVSALRSTVADIDLDAIAANLRTIAPRGEQVIAVVKADAYGHGIEVVARACADAGAVMLAVFTVEEGVFLRGAGIPSAILVLGGLSQAAEAGPAVEAGLTMTVWDLAAARATAQAARAVGRTAAVHVKVDTGLTRLGAPPDQAVDRYREIGRLEGLEVDGFYTHFANADVRGDETASEQLRLFASIVEALPARPRLVHASNSAGAIRFGASTPCNAIRPGIALYGIPPAPDFAAPPLRPALRWSSRILRIARVPKGTGVGYGHEYRLAHDGVIATVPVGYGDGLQRAARRTCVLVRGRRVPLVGRVAMDLCTLDVTGVDGVREGDEVVLIGEQDGERITADDLADAAGTNSYEVVTAIRRMVPRRYWRDGRVVATRTLADGLRWR